MDSNTFITILIISVFAIVIGHTLIKGLMGEPILRSHNRDRDRQRGAQIVHPSKDELLDYVTSHIDDLNRNRYVFNPKGSNFYNTTHDSDLHSELTDLSKYFEIQQSVPDTKKLLKELQCKDDLKDCKSEIKSKLVDNQTGNPLFFDQGSDGTLTYQPDIWKYENERVMNGGFIDGIRANDFNQSSFAVYPPSPQFKEENYLHSYPYTVTSGMF